jgi:transcriptional regulator with GAF, ATPase, and Fis domain
LFCEGGLINDIAIPVFKQVKVADENQIKTFTENERDHIIEALARCDWKIYGQGGAAEILQINASTLKSRMKKLGISKQFN